MLLAKFNKPTSVEKIIEEHLDKVENCEGGIAFAMGDKTKLYSQVATCLVNEPKFYGDKSTQVDEILDGIEKVSEDDPEFILKLAAHTRNDLHLRSIPVVLLVEAANINKCKPFVRKWAPSIICRADELSEAMAYQIERFGRPKIPNCLKKALADCFSKFDEYQFAKYDRDGKVKLKDVARLVHPIPENKERAKLYERVVNRTLTTPETWEVEISGKGSTKENWEKIMPKMGYMALLRNTRNFLDKGCNMLPIAQRLNDEDEIVKSKQLPFRFFSAYRSIEHNSSHYTSLLLDSIEGAMETSVQNIPKFEGITFMSADNSGSMDSPLSEKSTVKYRDVANLLQAISHKFCDVPITSVFGEGFAVVNVTKRNGIISNMNTFFNTNVGHSTNGYLAIQHLNKNKIKVDRIIIFTDSQLYDDTLNSYSIAAELKRYKNSINSKVFTYVFDLSGYGTMQFPKDESRVALIAGWSERILEFIKLFESDKKTAIDKIEKLTPYYEVGKKKKVKADKPKAKKAKKKMKK